MNADTDYVHTHIGNYEPTYLVLLDCVTQWIANDGGPLAPYRDTLRSAVESNADAMGLRTTDLTDAVDYADIVVYEADL